MDIFKPTWSCELREESKQNYKESAHKLQKRYQRKFALPWKMVPMPLNKPCSIYPNPSDQPRTAAARTSHLVRLVGPFLFHGSQGYCACTFHCQILHSDSTGCSPTPCPTHSETLLWEEPVQGYTAEQPDQSPHCLLFPV